MIARHHHRTGQSERGRVIVGVVRWCGAWWRLSIAFGWSVVPGLGFVPVVISGDDQWWCWFVPGDGVGDRFDDRPWVDQVGVAKPAPPDDPREITHIRESAPTSERSGLMTTAQEHVRTLAAAVRDGELTRFHDRNCPGHAAPTQHRSRIPGCPCHRRWGRDYLTAAGQPVATVLAKLLRFAVCAVT